MPKTKKKQKTSYEKCKIEIISKSDLLRARGFKVGSLESNVGGEIPIDQEQQDQEQEESSA